MTLKHDPQPSSNNSKILPIPLNIHPRMPSKNDETYYCQYFHATLSNNLFLTNPSTIHFNIDVSVGIYLNVLAIAGKY